MLAPTFVLHHCIFNLANQNLANHHHDKSTGTSLERIDRSTEVTSSKVIWLSGQPEQAIRYSSSTYVGSSVRELSLVSTTRA